MIGYSGWGLLPVLLPVIPFVVWINIADYGRGDWATACLVAALVALLLGALNLGIAALLNRDDSPQEDRMVWTGAHRSGGTALQSYTPMFLALAGAALAGWTIQWVPWQVAVGGYLAGIVAYFALPALSRRRVRAVAIVNRRAFAERHGWAFRDRLPGLSARWQFGRFSQSPAFAEMMNAPRGRLCGHFAAMSGVPERYTFTVVDAFEAGQWAVFRTWGGVPSPSAPSTWAPTCPTSG